MNANDEKRLESWKEIGAYLQRNAVTARRWEKEEGLPVHRHSHKARSSVYAYPTEIDAWRVGRRVAPDAGSGDPTCRPLWKMPAFALTLALCLVTVGNGIRPQPAAAQQKGLMSARLIWSGAGVDFTGQPTPDGRFLSFTDWETGNLGIRDLTRGVSRLLTKNKSAAEGYPDGSVPSPDGQYIAYRWHQRRISLRILRASGGEPKILPWGAEATYGRPVAWTPDSKQVLVIRQLPDETNQLAMVSVQDGSSRTLKSLAWRYPRRVSISPDGRFIAYDVPRENVLAYDIFVLAADGSKESAVVEGPANDSDPIWSPDGSRLIFLSNRTGSDSMWTVPVKDGKADGPAEQIKKGVGRMYPLGMTRNGALYYFSGGAQRNILLAELDESLRVFAEPVRISERFVDDNARAAWSPDGERLAYYAPRGGAAMDVPTPVTLVIRFMNTGVEREVPMQLLPLGEEPNAPPRWFPDGRSLLVAAMNPPAAGPGVGYYRVDAETGEAKLLQSTRDTSYLARLPLLTSDGSALYYFDSSIIRLDLNSGKTISLSQWLGDKVVHSPSLSPDGSKLAYAVVNASPKVTLEVMPSKGGPAGVVARIEPWSGISTRGGLGWTPDGNQLLFARSESGDTLNTEFYRVPLAGGQPEKIGIALKSGFLTSPALHPDGKRLAYSTRGLGTNEVWVLENFLPRN